MAQEVRLRFTLDSGNVDFYADEVVSAKLQNVKEIQVQENQTSNPYVKYLGDANYIFSVTFVEKLSTTKTRIDQLIDENAEMTVYYEYGYSPSNSLSMILYNKNDIRRTKIYYYGEEAAMVRHNLIFLQSS